MAPPPRPKRPPTKAEIVLSPLKNCLANLPPTLVAVLANTEAPAQGVVVQLEYRSQNSSTAGSEKSGHGFAYLGWTGLPSRQQTNADVRKIGSDGGLRGQDTPAVEIDGAFADLLGLSAGQKVGISLHLDPPIVHSVHVEPSTPSDWDMIQLNGEFLESNILSQIRVIPNPAFEGRDSPHQSHFHALVLHLSPTSTVQIIITSLEPTIPSFIPFAKISSDAEVVVAPKARAKAVHRGQGNDRGVVDGARKALRPVVNKNRSASPTSREIILLRAVDRAICTPWFASSGRDDNTKSALTVWVADSVLKRVASKWATISLIKPAGLRASLDQHQMQQLKEQEASEAGLVTSKVVVELRRWTSPPNDEQAALSSALCSVLGFDKLVGCIFSLEPAPAPLQRSDVKRIKIYPLGAESSTREESLRFGKGAAKSKEALADFVRELYTTTGSGLLRGPISDGMLLPPSQGQAGTTTFSGGILRLEISAKDSVVGASPLWIHGSEHGPLLDVQPETPQPITPAMLYPTFASTLPEQAVRLVNVDPILTACKSNLRLGSSVLLTGGTGTGKSDLARFLCQCLSEEYLFNATYLSCRKLVTDDSRLSTINDAITRLFVSASWCARLSGKSIVVLDDLDKICPAETEMHVGDDNGRSKLIAEMLCSTLRRYCRPPSEIVLLATAMSKDSLHRLLISGHVIGQIIELKAPSKEARRNILTSLVNTRQEKEEAPLFNKTFQSSSTGSRFFRRQSDEVRGQDLSHDGAGRPTTSHANTTLSPNVDLLDLAGRTDGFVPRDLQLLVSRARMECLVRTMAAPGDSSAALPLNLTQEDFTAALKNLTPSSLRSVPLTRSTTTFSSVGGLQRIRDTLLETLLYPTKYAPIFASCPLRLRSGLLLYGYPGCGKTLLASAVAGECGLNFISVKGPEILNKYIGASEKSVRDLFERAQAAKPCVLFFDEFDSIAPQRGHDSTGVTDRVVNQLLTQMDGAEGLDGVYVLAATSRPDLIDPALLRPGRLDKSLLCNMPDERERLDILKAVIQGKLELDGPAQEQLEEVARRSEGYSGADLQALMYNAHLDAVHELIGDGGKTERSGDPEVADPAGARNGVDHGEVLNASELKGRDGVMEKIIRFHVDPALDTIPSNSNSNNNNDKNTMSAALASSQQPAAKTAQNVVTTRSNQQKGEEATRRRRRRSRRSNTRSNDNSNNDDDDPNDHLVNTEAHLQHHDHQHPPTSNPPPPPPSATPTTAAAAATTAATHRRHRHHHHHHRPSNPNPTTPPSPSPSSSPSSSSSSSSSPAPQPTTTTTTYQTTTTTNQTKTATATVTITPTNIQHALSPTTTRPSISRHERHRLSAIYREFARSRRSGGEMPGGDGDGEGMVLGREVVGGRISLM